MAAADGAALQPGRNGGGAAEVFLSHYSQGDRQHFIRPPPPLPSLPPETVLPINPLQGARGRGGVGVETDVFQVREDGLRNVLHAGVTKRRFQM